ncbi:MAG TPA: hypothetical protein VGJ46_11240 [Candidatus Limnocylindrales bacterium]|jgi:hypothetical protein|nr:MAG: hypothetical protein E6I45_11295 [Chloroflexota bacterium]
MQQRSGTATPTRSPVDDQTYDLLQSLTSKLEAIEAYETYAADGGRYGSLFEELANEDRQHAEKLLDALRERLGSR